jgi:galactokinase
VLDLAALREEFRARFAGSPRPEVSGFRAPGRVNLIGEHTDYNDGFVLPIAIDRACCVLAQPRSDRTLRIHSQQFGETAEFPLDAPRRSNHWSDYVRGVAWALREAGRPPAGVDLLVASEVPLGSGLSSSAALEVSTAFALLAVSGHTLDRKAIALAAQRAENEFVGMRCGLMDQLAACFGREGHALLIDCRSLEITPVPLDESRVRIVVANTMVKHELAASAYNARRRECEDAAARLGVRALRDASWEEIESRAAAWPDSMRRRARHVTTENARVAAAVFALRQSDFGEIGRLMEASHKSLDEDYEVTCAELNTMVACARKLPGCYGARMTGGGFGGCTVSLVHAEAAEKFAAQLARDYAAATGLRPDVFICRASASAAELPL